MKLDSLGEIIAERNLNIIGDEKRKLIVKIGKPQTFPNSSDYYCPYQIIGLGKEKIRYAGGIDAVQSLILALKMIGADLYTSPESQSGKLRWEGDESGNLGFPNPDSMRDLVLSL
jgi:hypothetical protein